MKKLLTLALAAVAPTGAFASEQTEVVAAADAFFAALRSEDQTALAKIMIPEGVIFIHDRTGPEAPGVRIVPVSAFLESHETRTLRVDEVMIYDKVLIDGDMAQVWGPYRFEAEGVTTHCGINSMSFVKTDEGWKVGNTSFTMEPPEKCEALGAPEISQ